LYRTRSRPISNTEYLFGVYLLFGLTPITHCACENETENLIKRTSPSMVIYNGSDMGREGGGFGQFVTLLINVRENSGKTRIWGTPSLIMYCSLSLRTHYKMTLVNEILVLH